jgi:hypothetical protein
MKLKSSTSKEENETQKQVLLHHRRIPQLCSQREYLVPSEERKPSHFCRHLGAQYPLPWKVF